MELPKYLGMLQTSEQSLADAFMLVGERHSSEPEIHDMCIEVAAWSRAHVESLKPYIEKYGEDKSKNEQVAQIRGALFQGTRTGGIGLLADLQDLALLTSSVVMQWTTVVQAAKAMRDKALETTADECCTHADRQLAWLRTEIKSAAPQALVVPADKPTNIAASMPKAQTPTTILDPIWAPLVGGFLMLVVGVLGLLTGRPLLFPSLGPTAYLQAGSPANPAARIYNTIVGHFIGLGMGFLSVALFNAWNSPTPFADHRLAPERMGASVLAIMLTLLVALLLKAFHPPAGATTLLVTLGGFKTLEDALTVVAGVLVIAIVGEVARRLRLGQLTLRPENNEKRIPAPKIQ
ncbi:MAG: HPP family protein [Chloroflexota bacterium]